MKNNFVKMGVFGTAVFTTLAITGCATTTATGLTKTQCEQLNLNATDWQKLGEQDGLMGREAGYFTKHLQGCGKVTNMSPTVMSTPTAVVAQNQQAWEAGRQAGLKHYCTPLRAYQLGREGFSYQNVCPQAQMVELLKANDEGLYNYQRTQGYSSWNDGFYSFGWGYGGRYYAPPMYMPMPRVLPNYVPFSNAETANPIK